MSKPRLRVIGHRGAAGLRPENTLPSIQKALDLGVDGIEVDVHLAHDRLWVIHDETVDRTTNGTGRLADLSLDEIRALDAGNGARIPELSEVLARVPPSVELIVELKGEGTGSVVPGEIKRHRPDFAGVRVSSFRKEELGAARDQEPALRRSLLDREMTYDTFAAAETLACSQLHMDHKALVAPVELQSPLPLYAYTVNSLFEARNFFARRVSAVFTDRPDLLLKWRSTF